ncbi:MAG: M67 family metallopeptidase [Elusimicrobia bacterium]|nr:M67 family metallopeptidase [Elusimicrobiota bacterium]
MTLVCPQNVLETIKKWSEKCYPFEGCGLLLGRFGPESRTSVERFAPLSNLLKDRGENQPQQAIEIASDVLGRRVEGHGEYEFVMDPGEFQRISREAERENLDVVGVLHTHPDHPARPSQTDAAQPLLSGWSNVIVKVDQGRFIEARSWLRQEESLPFEEEQIILE